MEILVHRSNTRRRRNSARVNLILSVIFHVVVFAAGAFWAAREGMLGKGAENLTVMLVPREKKAEAGQKAESKPTETKPQTVPQRPAATRAADLPRPTTAPPPAFTDVAAPPPVDVPVLTFGDLGAVSGTVDPVGAYKGFIEGSIRSVWTRPEGVTDLNYVAEVEVSVSAAGEIESPRLKQSSGDRRWDEAVLQAVTAARSLGRPPPTGFPERFLVRFDVLPESEPLL